MKTKLSNTKESNKEVWEDVHESVNIYSWPVVEG